MSIEQLLLLIVFLIIPLIQSLLARRSKRRSGEVEPEGEPDLEDLVLERDEKTLPPYQPPPPPPPRLPKMERAPVIVRPPSAPTAEPVPARVAGTPARPLPALGAKQRAQSRHLNRLLPRDTKGLRRAILLAEVLGPPRSLDRADPFRR